MITSYENSIPTDSYFSDYDANFVTGSSPATLNVNTALGRDGNDGIIANDGPGKLIAAISSDGTAYGDDILLNIGEQFSLTGLIVNKLRITWVSDSSYRVFMT